MKPKIIETNSFSSTIPIYRTWYKFHDILWVSVMSTDQNRKSHLRRKSKPNFNSDKHDNEMCFWHSDWQFQKIENTYGIEIIGEKTFEIIKKYEGEIHRIDSVVFDIAIEFQHTLSVSLNEMNLRYVAHKELKFRPYLVLDFTEFSAFETIMKYRHFSHSEIDYYINTTSNEEINTFLRKTRKWFNTKYFLNENLFMDFSDVMIRFTPSLKNFKYLVYSKNEFLTKLLELDKDIKLEKAKENEKELLAKRRKQEETLREIERKKIRYRENVEANKIAVETGEDFLNFRRCLKHKLIRECINSLGYIELVKYNTYTFEKDYVYKKYHVYSIFQNLSSTPVIEVEYITNSKKNGKEYTFLYAEICVIKEHERGLKVFSFIFKPKMEIILVSKRLEFVRGFLHSTSSPALYIYNDKEQLISKEYFLFNIKVSVEEFNDLSDYYEMGLLTEENIREENNELMEKIEKLDKYDFVRYFYQNDKPQEILKTYYEENNLKQPLIVRNEI